MFVCRLALLFTLIMASLLAATVSAMFVVLAYGGRILPRRRDEFDANSMQHASVPPLLRTRRHRD